MKLSAFHRNWRRVSVVSSTSPSHLFQLLVQLISPNNFQLPQSSPFRSSLRRAPPVSFPSMAFNLLHCSLGLVIIINLVFSSNLIPRQSCSVGYTLCSPPGATGSSTYDIDGNLPHLYSNLVDTVNTQGPARGAIPTPTNPNGPARRQTASTICCKFGRPRYCVLNSSSNQVPPIWNAFFCRAVTSQCAM